MLGTKLSGQYDPEVNSRPVGGAVRGGGRGTARDETCEEHASARGLVLPLLLLAKSVNSVSATTVSSQYATTSQCRPLRLSYRCRSVEKKHPEPLTSRNEPDGKLPLTLCLSPTLGHSQIDPKAFCRVHRHPNSCTPLQLPRTVLPVPSIFGQLTLPTLLGYPVVVSAYAFRGRQPPRLLRGV